MNGAGVLWLDPAGFMPTCRDLTHNMHIASVDDGSTRNERHDRYVLGVVAFIHCVNHMINGHSSITETRNK
jgi:hypothetical protein